MTLNESPVTFQGVQNPRPGREATAAIGATGARLATRGSKRRRRGGGGGEELMVPEATPASYYGKPIIKPPTWESRDIAGYLFLGGLAGAGALTGAAADLTGRPALARAGRVGAAAAGGLSLVALVHDLGRPARFLNMLRVFKPTSPMSVGSWLLAGFVPLSGIAAAGDLSGRLPGITRAAGLGAAAAAPLVATYTAALICDTAVPAWHDGHRQMPALFAASSAAAAAGLGLLAAPACEAGPVRDLAMVAGPSEVVLSEVLKSRVGLAKECYETGKAGHLMKAATAATVTGTVASILAKRYPPLRFVAGAALMAGSALTRFGIFHAGVASAEDPKYIVQPQRERLAQRGIARL